MRSRDLVDYLAAREREQRAVVERASQREVIEFHKGLADHYARLLAEARGLSTGS